MNKLFLADLKDHTDDDIRDHIVNSYEAPASDVDKYDILVAYESVGSWGCDSSSFFLLRKKDDGTLHEVHGSHCSCHGFEGQFSPEATTIDFLQSDKFYFGPGGYDEDDEANKQAVAEFLCTSLP